MKKDNNRGMRDWLIFIRTAESGSLAEVARQPDISTPAVSKAVIRVEQYLGVTLFTRTHAGRRREGPPSGTSGVSPRPLIYY